MIFTRDDTLDVSRSDDSTSMITRKTPTENSLSLSFNTERFNSNDFEEETTINSIDESINLFSGLKKKELTLEEALESMGYEKCKELSNDFLERGNDKLNELESAGITAVDIATIFCYTFEWNEKAKINYGEGESPYRKLNNSLSVDRSNKTLKKTRYFLFLLLKALRKLPRFVPENRTLYRGIRFLVQTEPDPNFPKRKPYAKGDEKFWWTFTSTSLSLEATRNFIGKNDGSLFMLSGETWGYDISIFSDYPDEKEILLEPERKLSITSVSRDENIITVNAEIVDTPLVLKDIIEVGKTVKIKEKKSKHKEIPQNLRIENITKSTVDLAWDAVDKKVRDKAVSYQISSRKMSNGLFNRNPVNMLKTKETKCTVRDLEHEVKYEFRVRCVFDDGVGGWSSMVKIMPFSWKRCSDYVHDGRKYSVDGNNPRIATKINDCYNCYCTIIGNTPLPLNKVISWNIKILKSKKKDGKDIYIGVAPFDICQDGDNYHSCGWYFDCYYSTLWSGPPHDYKWKKYGPRKNEGEYVHTGDTVGVVIDTTTGDLSFVLNGVSLGVAYEGIPLDKPLVPCVFLYEKGDSIELDLSEVKENVDYSIPVPSSIAVKSIVCDSITLTWDAINEATFYHIEVDGNKLLNASTTNTFIKWRLLPESEHNFRVRTVKGNSVGEWSDAVKGRTIKAPVFTECVWRECPDYVNENFKYSINENNTKIAIKIGSDNHNECLSTIIGNTLLPSNKVTSWNIKISKSKGNCGGFYIGVAPYDISQNENSHNCTKCGWYLDYYESLLLSGPPHNYNYREKEYGPRKKWGEYVHTGDTVGVVMDTTKGDLSFVLNGVNCGVAYKGIPLNKPLVPCVTLLWKDDSVELDLTSEVKENVNKSVLVPSNITTKNITWDSVTLTWDAVERASFYQVEVDESKFWDVSTTDIFTEKGLFPETEYSFRVRTVKGNNVSEWSDAVKGRTIKAPDFTECAWKECPDYVNEKLKYSIDENNPRIANKTSEGGYYSTIIGNALLPLNKIISWNIKILRSKDNNGCCIYIGIAPSDINQNNCYRNYEKCGWYFSCYSSELYSGPPHKYYNKRVYGPRKRDREYVHTGDSVGVVMNTTKGELSFVLNGVNLGVAYRGIPLDKPLVPCAILKNEDDSVVLIL